MFEMHSSSLMGFVVYDYNVGGAKNKNMYKCNLYHWFKLLMPDIFTDLDIEV